MLIAGFPAGALQANCYLVATGPGAECVVIDPGQDSADRVRQTCAEHQLAPVAVLLSHGHFDHVGGAAELSEEYGIDVHIGAGDRAMLADPLSAVSAEFRAFLADQEFPGEPGRVVELDRAETLDLGGVAIEIIPTPGHTAGSTCYGLAAADGRPAVLFTGDTLFAGSIGRSDLPGGNGAQLVESIHRELLSRPDDTVVLPGHGPSTTVGAERTANPFL